MKTSHIIPLFILSFVLIEATFLTAFSQNPEQLYQQGLMKEEGQGSLQDAIEIFKQVVKNENADEALQAKALLHVGLCYEKLGQKGATKAYQQLVKDYPGQKQEVTIAKKRLNILLALQMNFPEPTFRKIPIPSELSWNVALSPDGQKLLLVSDEKLWIMPLSGNLGSDFPGKPIQLNTDGIKVLWAGLSWSGDGKSIAFNEFNEIWLQDKPEKDKRNQNIYIVSAEGGKPKKIVENYCDARAVNYRINLSPDGKTLAFSSVDDNEMHIYTIPVKGGIAKQLVESPAREPVFSPDGKMIAYVEAKRLGRGGGGLWVVPSSGGSPTFVVQAGNAGSPIWSPDARKIAFLDYYEHNKIYIIPVGEDGKPAGEKVTIDAPEGTKEITHLTGWSTDNKIGTIINRVKYALYTLPEQGGQAALVVHGGDPSQPRWSPDGEHIVFINIARGKGGWPNHKLAIVPADGGEITNILTGTDDKIGFIPYQTGIRVSPNGTKIVMSAKKHDDTVFINHFPTTQIWTIPIEGGKLIQITKPPVPYSDYSPCWSPDGKSIAFIRTKLTEERLRPYGETGIYTINSSGGEPKLLISESDKWILSINWSPDAKLIAYLTSDKEDSDNNSLNVVNVDNGITRVVGEVPQANVHTELAWSPDSKRIAFNDKEGEVIKVMSVDDGSVQDVETGLVNANIYHLDWSPDGKRFVFAGYQGGIPEFWLIENFLNEDQL